MRKFLTLTAAAAFALAFGFSGAAQAFDILTIGTQDNSNGEFGVSPAAGATADLGPYNYDADLNNFGSANKTSPNNGFPDIQAGPDEPAAGGVQPDDFNPLNLNFTLGCVLLPGTQGNLLVDLFQVRISNGGGRLPTILTSMSPSMGGPKSARASTSHQTVTLMPGPVVPQN